MNYNNIKYLFYISHHDIHFFTKYHIFLIKWRWSTRNY